MQFLEARSSNTTRFFSQRLWLLPLRLQEEPPLCQQRWTQNKLCCQKCLWPLEPQMSTTNTERPRHSWDSATFLIVILLKQAATTIGPCMQFPMFWWDTSLQQFCFMTTWRRHREDCATLSHKSRNSLPNLRFAVRGLRFQFPTRRILLYKSKMCIWNLRFRLSDLRLVREI